MFSDVQINAKFTAGYISNVGKRQQILYRKTMPLLEVTSAGHDNTMGKTGEPDGKGVTPGSPQQLGQTKMLRIHTKRSSPLTSDTGGKQVW